MRVLIFCAALCTTGCQSLSNATQYAFAPRHYDAPVLMKTPSTTNTQDLIIGDDKNFFLNSKHPMTESFTTGTAFSEDTKFAEFAYAYVRVANHKCERREADMLKGSTAQKTGFNLVTTASAVAGSALSSGNAANAASGAAAFFNSVNSNASSFQSAINGQYSANLLQAAANERKLQFGKIKTALVELKKLPGQKNGDKQAEISALLSDYNQICTVGRAQRSVNNALAN